MNLIAPIYNKNSFNPMFERFAGVSLPSLGASEYSTVINGTLKAFKNDTASSVFKNQNIKKEQSLSLQLFDALSAAKIFTAQVAMHINNEARNKLFKQLDALLDLEEWDAADKPLQQPSFETFIRLYLFLLPTKQPSLGLTYGGNIIASWINGEARLSIECQSNDAVRGVLSQSKNGERESNAFLTTITRLPEILSPYNPEQWFRP